LVCAWLDEQKKLSLPLYFPLEMSFAPTTSLALPRPLIARVRSRTPSFPLSLLHHPFRGLFYMPLCCCYTCPTYYYYTSSLLYFAGALFLLSSKKTETPN
jgi:hypothetical protein